jgi:hypothetical protein
VTALVGHAWKLVSLSDEHLGRDEKRPAMRAERAFGLQMPIDQRTLPKARREC